MANSYYPTGIGTQPLDLTSGAQAFMKSAIEARLGEIASSKEQVSEDANNIMKAMSVEAAPELFRVQQDRYNKEIEDYRASVRDIWKERGGKLTQDDRIKIQRGEQDLKQRMKSELNELKTFKSYQDKIYDPNFKYAYDPDKYQKILGSAYDRMTKGEGIGNIAAEAFQAQLQPSTGDYADKRYGNEIKRLSQSVVGEFKGNIFTSTSEQDQTQANNLLQTVMQDPNMKSRYTSNDGTVFEEEKQKVEQEVRDYINQRVEETKPYRQTTWNGSGKYKNTIDYTPSKFDYKGNDYSIVRLPSTISQTDRNFFINEATNLDTKGKEKLTQDNAKIVGVDVDKGVILLEGKGAFAQIGDENILIRDNKQPSKKSGKWDGKTASKIKTTDHADLLKTEYSGDRPIEEVKNIAFTDNEDGGVTVRGVVVVDKKGWGKGNKEVPVEIVYKPFVDPSSSAVYEAPLWSNKEAVSGMFSKVKVRNKPLESYFDEQDNGGTEANRQTISVSAYNKAKGKNYTKAQIEAAFGDKYKIID